MATHKSAVKRYRQDLKKTDRNRSLKSAMKTAVRAFHDAVSQGSEKKEELLKKATSVIAKTASKGAIKKQTAARKISRLAKSLAKAE